MKEDVLDIKIRGEAEFGEESVELFTKRREFGRSAAFEEEGESEVIGWGGGFGRRREGECCSRGIGGEKKTSVVEVAKGGESGEAEDLRQVTRRILLPVELQGFPHASHLHSTRLKPQLKIFQLFSFE